MLRLNCLHGCMMPSFMLVYLLKRFSAFSCDTYKNSNKQWRWNMPHSIRSKLIILVASSLGTVCSTNALAANAYLNFTAKWTNNSSSPLFFNLNADKTITGRFVIDLAMMPSDKATQANIGNYSYDPLKEPVNPWISFESPNLLFAKNDSDETLSRDALLISNQGNFEVRDKQKEQGILGCKRSPTNCWSFNIYPIHPDGSKMRGDQLPLSFDWSDLKSESHFLKWEINNTDPTLGLTGYEAQLATSPMLITDLSFVAPAPVPLPAAAWMFVAALGGFAGLRFKQQKPTPQKRA